MCERFGEETAVRENGEEARERQRAGRLQWRGGKKGSFKRKHLREQCSLGKFSLGQGGVLKPKLPVNGASCLTATDLSASSCPLGPKLGAACGKYGRLITQQPGL